MMRWEKDEWEIFAGAGQTVPKLIGESFRSALFWGHIRPFYLPSISRLDVAFGAILSQTQSGTLG